MKKINWFVIGYSVILLVLTTVSAIQLIVDKGAVTDKLPNLLVLIAIVAMGYLVSLGLIATECSDRKKNNIANNLYEGTGND